MENKFDGHVVTYSSNLSTCSCSI